jgi:DNA-binding MarR family transcriptional regulator
MAESRSPDPIERARKNWTDHGLDGADVVIAMASLARAHQIVEGRVDTLLKPLGLNMMRYNALATLNLSSGGRRMGRVGFGLMIHAATVTAVIDRLEKDRLVERRPDPDDRRSTLVVITRNGRSLVEKATELLIEHNFGLDGITPSDARALTRLLTPLRASAGDIEQKSTRKS